VLLEPTPKRAITFIDGQNLFHGVRESFGYTFPNYDVVTLSRFFCEKAGWNLVQLRFYTGIPDATDDPKWNYFWSGELAVMDRQRVCLRRAHCGLLNLEGLPVSVG
jgi:hypothetical protein